MDSYICVPTRLDHATRTGAIVALMPYLSNEVVKKGIQVNIVAAGPIWMPLLAMGVDSEG